MKKNQILIKNKKIEITEETKENLKKSNLVSTTMYNFFTFLPLSLYNQLSQFTNLYFVILSIISTFPNISTMNPFAFWVPVIFILLFSMSFDWYQDSKRFFSDRKINNKKIMIIRNGIILKIKTKNIKIGDFLIIKNNQTVMADVVLMSYKSDVNYCYIDTSTLDGEKNLKPKIGLLNKKINKSSFLLTENSNIEFLNLNLTYEQNTTNFYKFNGQISYKVKNNIFSEEENFDKIILDNDNFVPRSAIIKNTEEVIGLVIYIGKDTKLMKNTQKRIFKQSSVEKSMNLFIFMVILVLLLILIFIGVFSIYRNKRFNFGKEILGYDLKFNYDEIIYFLYTSLGYLLLMSTILPISLIVTLQLVKLFQNGLFELDNDKKYINKKTKKKCKIKSINLNEELGQVEYILSDKTGTLTQNKMVAKYFQINNFTKVLDNSISKIPEKNLFKKIILQSDDKSTKMEINSHDELNFLYYLNINTCHNCFSNYINSSSKIKNYENFKNNIKYEGPSPDEIALLKGSKDYCGVLVKETKQSEIILYTKENKLLKVKKLGIFNFDSNRKMMSVIIEYDGKILQMAKGSDTSIIERSSNNITIDFKRKCDFYLDKGLRMLFMGVRLLSKKEFEKYQNDLDKARKSNLEQIYKTKADFEKNFKIIGVSAVEDKLQENLKESIISLKKAGIKLWVITGDKMETALNIAKSAQLFNKNVEPIYITNDEELNTLLNYGELIKKNKKKKFLWRFELSPHQGDLEDSTLFNHHENFELYNKNQNNNLIITGKLLTTALKNGKDKFRRAILKKECVVFCRTNPKQKVQIVRLLKEVGIKTLSVGDGANDVNMIQEANIGVGIIGEEGKQAVNASDFVIPQFKYLVPLILSHGRLSYYRISQMILLFYYKNFLFTMPQLYFAFVSDFSRKNFYHDFYLSLYNLVFTAFNIAGRGLLQIDFDDHANYYNDNYLMECYTYYIGPKNKLFNKKKFFFWILIGTLESLYIFITIYFYLDENIYYKNHGGDYNIVSLLFYATVIIYQNFKLFIITNSWDFFNTLGLIFSILSFFLYLYFTNSIEYLGYLNGAQVSFNVRNFYIYLISLVFSLLIFNNFFFILKKYFYRSMKDKIRSLDKKLDDHNLEKLLKKWKKKDEEKKFSNFLFL